MQTKEERESGDWVVNGANTNTESVKSVRERMQALRKHGRISSSSSSSSINAKTAFPDKNGEQELVFDHLWRGPGDELSSLEHLIQQKKEFEDEKRQFKELMFAEDQNLKKQKDSLKKQMLEAEDAVQKKLDRLLADFATEYKQFDDERAEFENVRLERKLVADERAEFDRIVRLERKQLDDERAEFQGIVHLERKLVADERVEFERIIRLERKQLEDGKEKLMAEKKELEATQQRDEFSRKRVQTLDREISNLEKTNSDLKAQKKEFELLKQELVSKKTVLEQEERELARRRHELEAAKTNFEKEQQAGQHEIQLQREMLVKVMKVNTKLLEELHLLDVDRINLVLSQKTAQANAGSVFEKKKLELNGVKSALKCTIEKKKQLLQGEKEVLKNLETQLANEAKEYEAKMERVNEVQESNLQKLRRREEELMEKFKAASTML